MDVDNESSPTKCRIWTRIFNIDSNYEADSPSTKLPLVMIHGMGAGLAFYALNFDELAKNRTVYAIDLPGFARSSRCKFNSKPEEAEKQYVRAIEDWRQKVGIGKMCLLGHSFGGNDSLKITASTPHLKKKLFRLLIFSICFKISGARVAFDSGGSLGVSGKTTRGFKSDSLVGQSPLSYYFQTC